MPFFGVFFNDNTDIDETEVKKGFSKYGEVVSVRKNHSRVYVNFRYKDDAERCLNDTKNVYGEIKKGKFATTEQQNSSKESDSSNNNVRSGWIMHSNSDDKFERKQRNSTALMDSKFESVNTGSDTNSSLQCSDSETHKGSKNIIYGSEGHNDKKANDKISPRDSKKYGRQSFTAPQQSQKHKSLQNHNSSGNFQEFYDESCSESGPPPLLSVPVPASQNPIRKKPSAKSTHVKSPLFQAPNFRGSSLLGAPPVAPLLKQNEYDSDNPPPLLQAYDMSKLILPGWPPRDLDQPPPLTSTLSQPLPNRSKFTEHCYSPKEKNYGSHVLIGNVPQDTCSYEIEKVLFPHTPIYISEPEETNIRMNIFFCHVQFLTAEEACKAANQMDGVELRRHRLLMVTLDELLSSNTMV